jgi:hypothetical protein
MKIRPKPLNFHQPGELTKISPLTSVGKGGDEN